MKISVDPNLKGKELYRFLIENKAQLIAQKKSMEKWADAVSFMPSIYNLKGKEAIKAAGPADIAPDATTVRVKVVANTSMWCDSDMDVLLRDNAKKSMKDRKGLILHLKDHGRTLDDQIGDVADIYYEEISLKELGYNKTGTAQALIFETDIRKAYDERAFNKYKAGLIKQHSIGLRYVKLDLAINDPEDEKEFDYWNKYIDQVINREVAEEKGYFWVVPEIQLIENSAVLFGSNILTPTLEAKGTAIEPSSDTQEQPHEFDLAAAIKTTKFFN